MPVFSELEQKISKSERQQKQINHKASQHYIKIDRWIINIEIKSFVKNGEKKQQINWKALPAHGLQIQRQIKKIAAARIIW